MKKRTMKVLFNEIKEELLLNDTSTYTKIDFLCDRLLQIAENDILEGKKFIAEIEQIAQNINELKEEIEQVNNFLTGLIILYRNSNVGSYRLLTRTLPEASRRGDWFLQIELPKSLTLS